MADAGWPVTIPDKAELTLAALILPGQADADGWTKGVRDEVEGFLRTWCAADPWLAAHPPRFPPMWAMPAPAACTGSPLAPSRSRAQ